MKIPAHRAAIGALVITASALAPAAAQLAYTSGHADFGMLEGTELEPHFHAEGAIIGGTSGIEDEYEPDEIVTIVPLSVRSANPKATADFFDIPEALGLSQGDQYWNLFEDSTSASLSNSPFLGIGTEEGDLGVWDGDQVTISLTGLTGPGEFVLWQGGSGIKWASFGGIDAGDSLVNFPVGSHDHYNWAFSQAGNYEMTITVSALEGGNPVSASGPYSFAVVPEPGTYLVGFALLGGLIVHRLRRNRVA
ncbi:MAG: choice-of-anchor M domain-containing protein [Chthoniobacterales bacterium]